MLMMICAGWLTGCAKWAADSSALEIGLRQPITQLNTAVVTDDLPRIRAAARNVIATFDAATGAR
jgi:hypothetical protein